MATQSARSFVNEPVHERNVPQHIDMYVACSSNHRQLIDFPYGPILTFHRKFAEYPPEGFETLDIWYADEKLLLIISTTSSHAKDISGIVV